MIFFSGIDFNHLKEIGDQTIDALPLGSYNLVAMMFAVAFSEEFKCVATMVRW